MNNNEYLLDISHRHRYTASTRIQRKGTDELQYIPARAKWIMSFLVTLFDGGLDFFLFDSMCMYVFRPLSAYDNKKQAN
jgi:hypothetical protein